MGTPSRKFHEDIYSSDVYRVCSPSRGHARLGLSIVRTPMDDLEDVHGEVPTVGSSSLHDYGSIRASELADGGPLPCFFWSG
jgi:hypothetical protein